MPRISRDGQNFSDKLQKSNLMFDKAFNITSLANRASIFNLRLRIRRVGKAFLYHTHKVISLSLPY